MPAGYDADSAQALAGQAAHVARDDSAEAIGKGLAAVAFALLDVAKAIRETAGQE